MALSLRRWLVPLALLALSGLAYVYYVTRPVHPAPAQAPAVAWAFEAPKRGGIASTPLVAQDRIYVAAMHDTAFLNAGAVYCLDRATGTRVWRFDDAGAMQHTYSSPCLADGRLYIGEGMHANFTCKLYCLDAATGRKLWHFVAEGHIESSPCVADGQVFFGAGDDGLYCLDAATGKKRWQFQGAVHIDSGPAVRGRRVYAGSGVSRTYRATEAICLDAGSGKVVWRYPADLPVWGSPVISGDDVFFGLGNGRLLTPPEQPAGGVLCLAADSGQCRWRHDVGDAVFGRVVAAPTRVYFGSRDGHCYSLERTAGRLCWKEDLQSPVVASPALWGERLYVVAGGGPVCCLDADSGRRLWTFDVAGITRTIPELLSTPVVAAENGQGAPRLYVGTRLQSPSSSAAVLYCLRD